VKTKDEMKGWKGTEGREEMKGERIKGIEVEMK